MIEFWFDFASPYSYLAAMRIDAAARTPVLWRPFLLGPIFQQQSGGRTAFQNAAPAEARYRRRDVERLCARAYLALRWPSRYPRGSLLATRLANAARDEHWMPEFCRRIFRANFADDQDIADEAVVLDCLSGLCPEPERRLRAATEPASKAALTAVSEEAIARGLFGAPSFFVDNELFWGNDRMEAALDWADGKGVIPA